MATDLALLLVVVASGATSANVARLVAALGSRLDFPLAARLTPIRTEALAFCTAGESLGKLRLCLVRKIRGGGAGNVNLRRNLLPTTNCRT